MTRIVLIACGSRKQSGRYPAGELYVGSYFRANRQWAMRNADRWFILSAQYGLLDPGRVVASYERRLRDLASPQRKEWAKGIWRDLLAVVPVIEEPVLILAGRLYREALREVAAKACTWPLAGIHPAGLGYQIQWLRLHPTWDWAAGAPQ